MPPAGGETREWQAGKRSQENPVRTRTRTTARMIDRQRAARLAGPHSKLFLRPLNSNWGCEERADVRLVSDAGSHPPK